jgi:hypothetical protein
MIPDRLTTIVICSIIVLTVLSGCSGPGKISGEQATHIALNDTKVQNQIDNHSYIVKDVSVAHLSTGSSDPVEVYSVTIDVLNERRIRIVVFVSYGGKVVEVANSYPPAIPPANLVNETPVT